MKESFNGPKYLLIEGARDIVNNPLRLIIGIYPERYHADGALRYGVVVSKKINDSDDTYEVIFAHQAKGDLESREAGINVAEGVLKEAITMTASDEQSPYTTLSTEMVAQIVGALHDADVPWTFTANVLNTDVRTGRLS